MKTSKRRNSGKNSRMSVSERVKITVRGYKLLGRYCPGLARVKALEALAASGIPFVSIWLSARLIDSVADGSSPKQAVFYASALILVNFAASILASLLGRMSGEKENQMWNFFGKIFADKQLAMDYADLEDAGIQQRRKEAEEDLFMFGNGLGQLVWGCSGLVNALVSIAASILLSAALFIRPSGSAFMNSPVWIAILLLCALLGGLSKSRATAAENRIFERWCSGTVWFNRAFRFFGRELYSDPDRAKDARIYEQNFIADRFLRALTENDRDDAPLLFRMSLYPALAGAAVGTANACCWVFIAVKAFFGAFGAGSVVQYAGAITRLGGGLQELMFILSDNEVYCRHLRKLFDYLDLPNGKRSGTLPVKSRESAHEIEFRDVSFSYPASASPALSHVNLKLRAGEKLAVVGKNGSGKTTFIKLLCRLYDPTEGAILLDGIDIKKYGYQEYLKLFSVVFQDFKLFAFPIAQNVAADTVYDRERVDECLRKAGFGERLDKLPLGSETRLYRELDEDGVEISGGEAQKIALARALYRDSPFIILDEPTAALDPVAEFEVYSGFNGLVGDKTAVYISHRLASCRFCDEIAVFDGGRIVQSGSHARLLSDPEGLYRSLWEAQAGYYR